MLGSHEFLALYTALREIINRLRTLAIIIFARYFVSLNIYRVLIMIFLECMFNVFFLMILPFKYIPQCEWRIIQEAI